MSSNPPPRRPLKVQPKNFARRSQAERDALEKAEAERRRARAEAAAADAAAEASSRRAEYGLPANDHRQDKWRGHGGFRTGRGGRGGFMGHSGTRIFSRPSRPHMPSASSRMEGFAQSSGRRSEASTAAVGSSRSIKREPGIKQDIDDDIAMLGIPGLKSDPDGYASSDPEEAYLGSRINIDNINLVSEDEEQDNASDTARDGELKATTEPRPPRRHRVDGAEPIRLPRKEHKDRVVNVNTEASSTTTAAVRKKDDETAKSGQAGSSQQALTSVTRKAKTRSKDLEVIGDRRRWRGVWDEEDDMSRVKIKQEPMDEFSHVDLDAAATELETQAAMEVDGRQAPGTSNTAAPEPLEPEKKAHVRAKLKQKRISKARPPMYQTAEELREWDKRQDDLATIQQELGRINVSNESDRVGTSEAQDNDLPDNRRQDAVYLFQLPTILPDLVDPTIKKEPGSPTLARTAKPTQAADPGTSEETPIKIEDNEFGGDLTASRRRKLTLAPGLAGKLRIHKSGRSTMTWGGTNMEMKMGVSPYFLQTAILTSLSAEGAKPDAGSDGENGADKVGGHAISFGQIRGKLVVVPAWSDILGERGLA